MRRKSSRQPGAVLVAVAACIGAVVLAAPVGTPARAAPAGSAAIPAATTPAATTPAATTPAPTPAPRLTTSTPPAPLPAAAPWGLGLSPGSYASVTIRVVPHPDDEGSLWADELNTGTTSFPVFVYLTNGENTAACTNDRAVLPSPSGNLGPDDRPPFNDAGNLTGAPAGYLGGGLPPEYYGAQGDNPAAFPVDPKLDRSTGWAPLASAGTVTVPAGGRSWTEGFAGPCRTARLAAMTAMFSAMNAAVAGLSAAADRAFFPSVYAGQPPDGQVCFPAAAMNEVYLSQKGRYSTPQPGGDWLAADTPAGLVSPKDACAYDWLTPTGDIFAFNLGDQSSGFKAPCASDLGGRLRTGGRWPAGTNGFDSVGGYPEGTRPVAGSACSGSLPPGQEGYGVTPSDAVWALQQVVGSGRLPAGLALSRIEAAGYVNAFNLVTQAPGGTAGIDVLSNTSAGRCSYHTAGGSTCAPDTPPPDSCVPYAAGGHMAAALAVQWNLPVIGVPTGASVCGGDPMSARTFGTTSGADGIRFWTWVYDYDGGGGWEAAARVYSWLTGPGAFDHYGRVTDTCPGSEAVSVYGQSEWSCQESVTRGTASSVATPGDGVEGMSNLYPDSGGESFTRPM